MWYKPPESSTLLPVEIQNAFLCPRLISTYQSPELKTIPLQVISSHYYYLYYGLLEANILA